MTIKPYKTFNEQINILQKEGLIIQDRNRLYNYLKECNFQLVIDGYNDPFIFNPDQRGNSNFTFFYRHNDKVNSDMILDFFDIERDIAAILLKELLEFENKLNTSVCHEILRALNNQNVNSFIDNSKKITSLLDKNCSNSVLNKIFIQNKNTSAYSFTRFKNPQELADKSLKQVFTDCNTNKSNILKRGNQSTITSINLYKKYAT